MVLVVLRLLAHKPLGVEWTAEGHGARRRSGRLATDTNVSWGGNQTTRPCRSIIRSRRGLEIPNCRAVALLFPAARIRVR